MLLELYSLQTLYSSLHLESKWSCAWHFCPVLPYSPSWDAYALDDTNPNLSHEHKEEDHEVERAVTPVKNTKKKKRLLSSYICEAKFSAIYCMSTCCIIYCFKQRQFPLLDINISLGSPVSNYMLLPCSVSAHETIYSCQQSIWKLHYPSAKG